MNNINLLNDFSYDNSNYITNTVYRNLNFNNNIGIINSNYFLNTKNYNNLYNLGYVGSDHVWKVLLCKTDYYLAKK